jgi:hypothetical protein
MQVGSDRVIEPIVQTGDRKTRQELRASHTVKSKLRPLEVRMESTRDTLQKIVAEMLARVPKEQAPVVAWQFVCGKTVADRTEALSFEGGVLRVRVQDLTWRTQLADMMPHYLQLLRQYTGQKVDRLDFVLPEGKQTPR